MHFSGWRRNHRASSTLSTYRIKSTELMIPSMPPYKFKRYIFWNTKSHIIIWGMLISTQWWACLRAASWNIQTISMASNSHLGHGAGVQARETEKGGLRWSNIGVTYTVGCTETLIQRIAKFLVKDWYLNVSHNAKSKSSPLCLGSWLQDPKPTLVAHWQWLGLFHPLELPSLNNSISRVSRNGSIPPVFERKPLVLNGIMATICAFLIHSSVMRILNGSASLCEIQRPTRIQPILCMLQSGLYWLLSSKCFNFRYWLAAVCRADGPAWLHPGCRRRASEIMTFASSSAEQ